MESSGANSSVSNLKAMFEKNIQKQADPFPIKKSQTGVQPKTQTAGLANQTLAQKKNEVVKEDKPKEEVKASVSDLKSVFEKKNTTIVPGKGVQQKNTGGDSSWIKTSQTITEKSESKIKAQEQPKQPLNPFSKEAQAELQAKQQALQQNKVQPKPLQQNIPSKSQAGEITSNKQQVPAQKQQEVIISSNKPVVKQEIIPPKKEEEKKVVVVQDDVVKSTVTEKNPQQEAPKKLVINDVFKAQAKPSEIPFKKPQDKADPIKKVQQNNVFPKKEEQIPKQDNPIQKSNPVEKQVVEDKKEVPKKLPQSSVFGQTKAQQEPIKAPPKQLSNPFTQTKPQESPFIQNKKEEVILSSKKQEVQEPVKIEPPKKQEPIVPEEDPIQKQRDEERVRKLFSNDDDEEEEEEVQQQAEEVKEEPIVQEIPQIMQEEEEPVALVKEESPKNKPSLFVDDEEEEEQEAKNSLAALLSKANPLMPGVPRKATVMKRIEEPEPKEKIQFDIFNELDEDAVNTNAQILFDDDEDDFPKPAMKEVHQSKKVDLFESDEY